MTTDADPIAKAKELAALLTRYEEDSYGSVDRGPVLQAVEPLRIHAGKGSDFYKQAADVGKGSATPYVARSVGQITAAWAEFAAEGWSEVSREAQSRVEAATDLMEQVEIPLTEARVHPVAPVMLAGAALEEMLRSMTAECPVEPRGKGGIDSYARALREADMITVQPKKDVDSWAGLRNQAAHGRFEQIRIENARLMAQGVNLFMQQVTG